MNLFELKKEELQEIVNFYYFMEDYGHMFGGYREDELNEEFKNIISSINTIKEIMDDNYCI